MFKLLPPFILLTTQLFVAFSSRELRVVLKADINETIAEWREECYRLRDYPNLKCEPSKVYLIDTTARNFESARDYCRELDIGNGISELLRIDSCDEFEKIRELLSDERIEKMDSISRVKHPIVFWTSGYSSKEMRFNSSEPEIVFKWLSGEYIEKKLIDECLTSDRGNGLKILQIHKTSEVIARFTIFDANELGFALCQFVSPDGILIPTTTSFPSSTSSTISTTITRSTKMITTSTEESESCNEESTFTVSNEPQSTTTTSTTTTTTTTYATTSTTEPTTTIATTENEISETTTRICVCNDSETPSIKCDPDEFLERSCLCDDLCNCEWYYSCSKNFFEEIEEMITEEKEAVGIAEKFVDELKRVNLTDGDLIKTVGISENLTILFERQKKETRLKFDVLAKKIISGFDLMLDNKNTRAWSSLPRELHTEVGQDMLKQMNELGHRVACDQNIDWSMDIVENHISMESFSISGYITTDFSFPSKRSNITTQNEVRFTKEIDPPDSGIKGCDHSTASGIIYKNLNSKLNPGAQLLPNSKLIAFSFSRNSSIKLENNTKVSIRLKHDWSKRRGDQEKCMFWNFDIEDWSEEGCRVVQSTKTYTVCECDHLTNFAVLMDITGRETPSDSKTWLTLVCSTISMICLIITICALVSIKSLRSRRSVITTNLCICLLVINLLTSFGLQQTQNTILCQSISIILMYSVASAFLWMLLEGYILYQMIILVFHSVGHIRKRWMFCIGYGLSFVWVMIALSIIKPSGFYNSDLNYFCWLSSSERPGLIWIFVGPALLILALNLAVFVMSLRATIIASLKKQTKQDQDSNDLKPNIKRWLKGWTSLLILLGLSWLTALLYIHADFYFAAYIFIVLNGLQGFFIFLFEIAFNKKARSAILHEVSTKLPLSKTSSSNPLASVRTKSTSTLSMKNSNESSNSRNSRKELNNKTVANGLVKTSF